MKARDAVRYLDKPVMYKSDGRKYMDISDGVYKLSEIQQNWRMVDGAVKSKTRFCITELKNPRANYWVEPEGVSEFNGEITSEIIAGPSDSLEKMRERHTLHKAYVFGTPEERADAEAKIKEIQERTMETLRLHGRAASEACDQLESIAAEQTA